MDDDLFPEPAALPASVMCGVMSFGSDVPVRFVDGYQRFAGFARAAGADPSDIAGSVASFWTFVAAHPEIGEDADVAESAALFFGNVIAAVHPAARWQVWSEPAIGTDTMSIPVRQVLRGIIEHPSNLSAMMESLAQWPHRDADAAEISVYMREHAPPVLRPALVPYVRPDFPGTTYRDDDGQVIRYGSRWAGPAPDDAYERVSHPERFAPLASVAEALVAHLCAAYVVDVVRTRDGDVMTIRLSPTQGAPVVLTVGAEHVGVYAGAGYRAMVPDCACDACDESLEGAATMLEAELLDIAAGGLRELYPIGRQRLVLLQRASLDGGFSSSAGELMPADTDDHDEAGRRRRLLATLVDGWWPSWTLRSDTPDIGGDPPVPPQSGVGESTASTPGRALQ